MELLQKLNPKRGRWRGRRLAHRPTRSRGCPPEASCLRGHSALVAVIAVAAKRHGGLRVRRASGFTATERAEGTRRSSLFSSYKGRRRRRKRIHERTTRMRPFSSAARARWHFAAQNRVSYQADLGSHRLQKMDLSGRTGRVARWITAVAREFVDTVSRKRGGFAKRSQR